MHEVERAVDRINDPEVVALGGADAAGFFRQNGVIWIGVLQAVDDGGFGGAVGGVTKSLTDLFSTSRVSRLVAARVISEAARRAALTRRRYKAISYDEKQCGI